MTLMKDSQEGQQESAHLRIAIGIACSCAGREIRNRHLEREYVYKG